MIGNIDEEKVGALTIRLRLEKDSKVSVHTDREESRSVLERLEVQARNSRSVMKLLQRLESSGSHRLPQLPEALTKLGGRFGADRSGHLGGVLR